MNTTFLFVFGRTPKLSLLELESVFSHVRPLTPHVALVEQSLDPQQAIDCLGGTIKIAHLIKKTTQLTLEEFVTFFGQEVSSYRTTFGVSSYDTPWRATIDFLGKIKHQLEAMGLSARFVAGQDGELSTVVVSKRHLTELVVVPQGCAWLLAQTVAVQDFVEWSKRDRGRPFADPKRGMLPPKVARMAVNIALGRPDLVGAPQGKLEPKILLDPFCGMGTILSEAVLGGCRVIGSDVSEKALNFTKGNLEWLLAQYHGVSETDWKLLVTDATHVSEKLPPGSVEAIVTEPFLGTSRLGEGKIRSGEKIENIIKGLEKLYIGCLRDWWKLLKAHGRLVIALPAIVYQGTTIRVKKVIDTCENLGYTLLAGPIEYSRPQAVVRREFYIFQKK